MYTPRPIQEKFWNDPKTEAKVEHFMTVYESKDRSFSSKTVHSDEKIVLVGSWPSALAFGWAVHFRVTLFFKDRLSSLDAYLHKTGPPTFTRLSNFELTDRPLVTRSASNLRRLSCFHPLKSPISLTIQLKSSMVYLNSIGPSTLTDDRPMKTRFLHHSSRPNWPESSFILSGSKLAEIFGVY